MTTTNRKRLLLPDSMARAGWQLLEGREDVEGVSYPVGVRGAKLHEYLGDAHGIALSVTPFSDPELDAGPALEVVARIGVGYDAVDVPALTRRRIPLMVAGTANSVSVAEQAMFLMLALAKRGAELASIVHEGRWGERHRTLTVDLYGKTLLVVGFGRIGTRIARRCNALEMNVVVYDPYVPAESIRAAGCEPAADLDAAVARADFITIHCPKTQETTGLFDGKRLARMKPSAYLVNTARGGIVDEAALHAALTKGTIAGAGLDVFDEEPTPVANPLLKLPNLVVSPHMAGVSREAVDRMAVATVRNMLSVIDGAPIKENVVNPEVLG
jgi:D-3-phosphoglycerate dehydrogenase